MAAFRLQRTHSLRYFCHLISQDCKTFTNFLQALFIPDARRQISAFSMVLLAALSQSSTGVWSKATQMITVCHVSDYTLNKTTHRFPDNQFWCELERTHFEGFGRQGRIFKGKIMLNQCILHFYLISKLLNRKILHTSKNLINLKETIRFLFHIYHKICLNIFILNKMSNFSKQRCAMHNKWQQAVQYIFQDYLLEKDMKLRKQFQIQVQDIIKQMKLVVFLMLVVALTALNLASNHEDWDPPMGACEELLHNKIDNEDGKLVIKAGGSNYDQTCDDILLNQCTLYASCKNRMQRYQMAQLKLSGEFQKACCTP